MKISREVADKRIAEFLETVVLPGLKGGKKDNAARFKIGVALTMGWTKITDDQYDAMKETGLADAEGVDLEQVRKAVEAGVKAAGGEVLVEKLGIWLSADDVAKLFKYLESGTLA